MSELILNLENHRTRQRIRNMGEVFTPEQYVNQMLDLFSKSIWASEETTFFEPTVGHGNILIPILQRRISTLENKYLKQGETEPTIKAISVALNTLWAIDICPLNIELAQKRVFFVIANYYKNSESRLRLNKARDFWGHVLCTIYWQVHENEALSALSDDKEANLAAAKTKLSKRWYNENGQFKLNFNLDWITYYQDSVKDGVVPKEYLRALRFFDSNIEKPNSNGYDEFAFAKEFLHFAINRTSIPEAGVA